MKAAVFYGKNQLLVQDIEKPSPGPGQLLVQVKACGVCGTDLHIYEGAQGAAECVPPKVLGHEFSGIVCDVGPDVSGYTPGDRVCIDPNNTCGACYYCKTRKAHFCEHMVGYGTIVNGGFAEYCVVDAKAAYKFGPELSFEEAAMAEPLACCLNGVDLTGIRQGQTVVIIGGGTIGLIMLKLVRLAGAATVILTEPVAEKREKARELGADIVVDPRANLPEAVLEKAGVKNVDAVIECVGRKQTVEDAIRYAGNAATVMLFGLTEPNEEVPVKPFALFRKELTLKTSYINPYTQQRAVDLLQSKAIILRELITDVIALSDIESVFTDASYRSHGKIMIKP